MRTSRLSSLLTLAVFFGLLAWSPGADARKKKRKPIRKADNIGLGVGAVGLATGISGKYYLDKNLSVQAVFGGWGLAQEKPSGLRLATTADALIELPAVAKFDTFKIAPVLGGGGWIQMATELTHIGAGGTAGLAVLMKNQPIEIALEYRPTFGIINTTEQDWVSFGAHLHYAMPMNRLRR